MQHNVGTVDRIVRFLVGSLLCAYTLFSHGPYNWVGMMLGAIPLITGVFGFCPLYSVLGIDTRRRRVDALR